MWPRWRGMVEVPLLERSWARMHYLLLHVMTELHMGYITVVRSKWVSGGEMLRIWFRTMLPPNKLLKSFEYIPCTGASRLWDGLEMAGGSLLVTPPHECRCRYHSSRLAWGTAQYRGAGQGKKSLLGLSVSMHTSRSGGTWMGCMEMGVFALDPVPAARSRPRASSCPPSLPPTSVGDEGSWLPRADSL